MSKKDKKNLYIQSEDEEYLTRCVVDTSSRRFYLYSNEGTEQVVDCETVEHFMELLTVCRDFLTEELVYADPIVSKK
jgi:imidazoleglycerol phosphate dehydratase HisB